MIPNFETCLIVNKLIMEMIRWRMFFFSLRKLNNNCTKTKQLSFPCLCCVSTEHAVPNQFSSSQKLAVCTGHKCWQLKGAFYKLNVLLTLHHAICLSASSTNTAWKIKVVVVKARAKQTFCKHSILWEIIQLIDVYILCKIQAYTGIITSLNFAIHHLNQ